MIKTKKPKFLKRVNRIYRHVLPLRPKSFKPSFKKVETFEAFIIVKAVRMY